jgi:hypothetical protein
MKIQNKERYNKEVSRWMNHTNHGLHSMSGNNFVPFYSISLFLAFAFLLFEILQQNFGLFQILEISDS